MGKKDNLYNNYHHKMATNLIGSCPCSPIKILQLDSISSSHYGIIKFKTETRKNGVTYKANPCNDHKSPDPDCKSPNPDCKSPNPDCKSPYPDCKSPNPDCKSPNPDCKSPNPDCKSPNPDCKRTAFNGKL